jgi:hypothetical protein
MIRCQTNVFGSCTKSRGGAQSADTFHSRAVDQCTGNIKQTPSAICILHDNHSTLHDVYRDPSELFDVLVSLKCGRCLAPKEKFRTNRSELFHFALMRNS